jgi:hypothetical protein
MVKEFNPSRSEYVLSPNSGPKPIDRIAEYYTSIHDIKN